MRPTASTGLDMFRATLARGRDAVLVHYFDQPITAGQIDEMSDALAVALQRRGAEHGERIAMYLQNIPQVLIAVLAAWKCGAVIVPCNPMLRERELVKILSDSGSRVPDLPGRPLRGRRARGAAVDRRPAHDHHVAAPVPRSGQAGAGGARRLVAARQPRRGRSGGAGRAPRAAQVPEPVDLTGDDVAFMVYTSGTTGEPKAAMNTHRNVVFATSVYEHWIGLTATDTILGLAPLFHVTGLIGHVTLAMLTGSPLVLFYRFDAEEALPARRTASRHVHGVRGHRVHRAPQQRGDGEHDLSSLTKVYTGGAPTPPGVLDDWYRADGHAHPADVRADRGDVAHAHDAARRRAAGGRAHRRDVGRRAGVRHRRAHRDRRRASTPAPREIGELVIAGPQIIPGYWQKPKETAESLRDGELRTGDVGFMDEQGWFYLVDRAKDMIVASGFKVWPREVEEVLYLHPAVREAAVIGIADPYRGETIKAVISLKAGHEATVNEIKAFARERMAAYKYPRVVEIVDELPKTTSGKIMRRLLQTTRRRGRADARRRSSSSPACRIRSCAPRSKRARCSKSGPSGCASAAARSRARTSEALYERLRAMLGHLDDDGTIPRPRRLLRRQRGVSRRRDRPGRERAPVTAFRRLRLRELLAAALKDTPRTPENVVSLHEHLTDAIAAGDADAAVQAILSWGETSRAGIREALGGDASTRTPTCSKPAGVVEDLSIAQAKEQSSLAGDVDALVLALDARAALEIGIAQTLGVVADHRGRARGAGRAAARVHAARARHQRRARARATSAPTMRSTASSSACCATSRCSRSTTRWTCRS